MSGCHNRVAVVTALAGLTVRNAADHPYPVVGNVAAVAHCEGGLAASVIQWPVVSRQ